jgi:hypothetical protein
MLTTQINNLIKSKTLLEIPMATSPHEYDSEEAEIALENA